MPFAVDPKPMAAEALELHEELHRLRNTVHQLPKAERDVVRSGALDGPTYAETGRRRGLHPAAVKSRAFRARRRLEQMLED